MRRLHLAKSAGLLVTACLLAGCGRQPSAEPVQEAGRTELMDAWDMYSTYAAQNGKPPGSADDLKPLARGSPTAGRVLADANYVILFKTPVGGSNVLAYHKDAATRGGLVLLSDGTVKAMTAAEFQAAPKAGK